MIPLKLILTNFLSYHQTTEVDFTPIHLACISGNNGAGKSTLLDAITWALFGKARRVDDALIFGSENECTVVYDFEYEGDTYRIQRGRQRGKTGTLDLLIHHPADDTWHSFSEKSMRETETRIQKILRMDYETFTNASFFLQGKADQFAQQKPGDRKRILGSILGLDIWETYREKAAEHRKTVDAEITSLDDRMAEIRAELAEEPQRKAHLAELEAQLKQTSLERKLVETQLEQLRQQETALKENKKLLDTFSQQLNSLQSSRDQAKTRLKMRQNERDGYQEILARAEEISNGYQSLLNARKLLEECNRKSTASLEIEKKISAPRMSIEKQRALMQQEISHLRLTEQNAIPLEKAISAKKAELEQLTNRAGQLQPLADERPGLEAALSQTRDKAANLRSENNRLFDEMAVLDKRRSQLQEVHETVCPLCGQDLTPEHRAQVVADITQQGREKGDAHRANKAAVQECEAELARLDARLKQVTNADEELKRLHRQIDQLQAWLEQNQKTADEWREKGQPHLAELIHDLEADVFCPRERAELDQYQAELKALEYDLARHEQLRREEASLRIHEEEYRQLDSAKAALSPLEREIKELSASLEKLTSDIALQQANLDQTRQKHDALAGSLPDPGELETTLRGIVEQDNSLRLNVGAAKQRVAVLDDRRNQLTAFTRDREDLATQAGRFRTLEKAFSKDGVPALLIEQALPEIESEANIILDRLTAGAMSIRFLTQRDYKDKSREDKKETLDIQISDASGMREYEMFSGGEAFRVNFAIRLAMSRVLAQRSGARLQTLVIDEGFGSQDAAGRQRLIEAINMVQHDFARVLVITHLEELKDAFPHRIEVEKTPDGSTVRVIA